MAAESIGDDNPIEEILLTGFPNPERKGCPSPDVIEALGQRKLGRDHPAWQHIWSCSPCFRDFKTVRDERLAGIAARDQSTRSRRRFVSVAVASACAGVAGYFAVTKVRPTMDRGSTTVLIDLSSAGPRRGEIEENVTPVGKLPRRLDELHLTLPALSKLGRYIVAVFRLKSENTAIALGSAATTGTESRPLLIVTLDLTQAQPGNYFLGTRLDEQGQPTTANYYPILIAAG